MSNRRKARRPQLVEPAWVLTRHRLQARRRQVRRRLERQARLAAYGDPVTCVTLAWQSVVEALNSTVENAIQIGYVTTDGINPPENP